MFTYLIFEAISISVAVLAFCLLVIHLGQHRAVKSTIKERGIYIPIILVIVAIIAGYISNKTFPPDFAMPAFMHAHTPDKLAPAIPFQNIFSFLMNVNKFEKVSDISADPNNVPIEPLRPDPDGIVRIHLKAQEVIAEIAPGIYQNYWTYNKQVPGPMLRIREGSLVELTLENDKTSLHDHSIDLHAVNGPGGGATLTHVTPGEKVAFRFRALNPGLYIYHCAMPNVSTHNSHGQYGLILVDPIDTSVSLTKLDKEFYVVQGEFYAKGGIGKRGLIQFDADALLNGTPNYVVFNGKVEGLPRMKANVGDRIRMYVGNGGVNLVSSFHVIGEIFDKVYPEGAIGSGSAVLKNVQTTAVLPGGSSIVEFTVNVPGRYLLVDHALARMNKGAWAILEVSGEEHPGIFAPANDMMDQMYKQY